MSVLSVSLQLDELCISIEGHLDAVLHDKRETVGSRIDLHGDKNVKAVSGLQIDIVPLRPRSPIDIEMKIGTASTHQPDGRQPQPLVIAVDDLYKLRNGPRGDKNSIEEQRIRGEPDDGIGGGDEIVLPAAGGQHEKDHRQ